MLGLVIFIIFITWSLSFYIALIPETNESEMKAAEITKEKIINYLTSDVFKVPVIFNSGSSGLTVLHADNLWYSGNKTTTRVFFEGIEQECIISGDTLFWQSDVSAGQNIFEIKFSENNEPQNCSGNFSVVNSTLAVPGVIEISDRVSNYSVQDMLNTSYEEFTQSLRISENFYLSLRSAPLNVTYGNNVSRAENIFPIKYENAFWDGEPVTIMISVW